MKKVIEYRNITGIKYADNSELFPGQFVKYGEQGKAPVKPKKIKKVVKDDETRDTNK